MTERQLKAWLVADAATQIAQEDISTEEAKDYLVDKFTPVEIVPNELIAEVVDNLEQEVSVLIGE